VSGSADRNICLINRNRPLVQEAEERVTNKMRRSLEEQQAEWERVLRTNRDKAEQEKRTIINR
jgi:hypothetical protein